MITQPGTDGPNHPTQIVHRANTLTLAQTLLATSQNSISDNCYHQVHPALGQTLARLLIFLLKTLSVVT